MLDWKNRASGVRDNADESVGSTRNRKIAGGWFTRVVGGLLALYLLVTVIVGWFPVNIHAKQGRKEIIRQLVRIISENAMAVRADAQ